MAAEVTYYYFPKLTDKVRFYYKNKQLICKKSSELIEQIKDHVKKNRHLLTELESSSILLGLLSQDKIIIAQELPYSKLFGQKTSLLVTSFYFEKLGKEIVFSDHNGLLSCQKSKFLENKIKEKIAEQEKKAKQR